MGYRVGPRLRELAHRGQKESGDGIHATPGPPYRSSLKEDDRGDERFRYCSSVSPSSQKHINLAHYVCA